VGNVVRLQAVLMLLVAKPVALPLWNSIRGSKLPVLVSGEFNAWHTAWRSRSNTRRGETLYDLIVSLGLSIYNKGNAPIFETGDRQSIVDLTIASPELALRIDDWRVDDKQSLSVHNYVHFTLNPTGSVPPNTARQSGWKLSYQRLETLQLPPSN